MARIDWLDLLKTWPVIVSGAIAAIFALRRIWRTVVAPVTLAPVAAFVARVMSTMDKVDEMSVAFGVNGGKSLADLIRSTSSEMQVTGARVGWLVDQLDRPLFEQAPDGRNLRINQRFTDTFGYTPEQMLDHGWIRILHEDDREEFMREWTHALRDRRLFEQTARILTRARVVQQVRVTLEPRLDARTGACLRWFGRMETVSLGTGAPD